MSEQRKPAGMPTGDWVEALIRQAEMEGKFDGVADAPDPMAGVDPESPDDPDWWLKKLVARENLTIVPEQLAVRREVSALRGALWLVASERELRERVAALNARIVDANLANTSVVASDLAPLDPERVVAQWRTARIERGLRAG
jgi:hypothetical protein